MEVMELVLEVLLGVTLTVRDKITFKMDFLGSLQSLFWTCFQSQLNTDLK